MSKNINACLTSNSDDWSTPYDLFTSLDQEFNFTLDPCASDENHKCSKFFTINDNGLDKSWKNEVVFCNPPYSQIALWCKKCFDEWLHNKTKIVLLIPSRTDTRYFHQYVLPFAKLRFIKGRLHFNNSKGCAPFPSLLAIYD